ncbi:MAG: methyl-accepting chemotaxis protein [Proteobacteria bacterium]|nr:methyl-accepting chemotaxis protein [Pseudomonadota bacterium]
MKNSILSRFIIIVTILTLLLISTLSLIITIFVIRSQSIQTEKFISVLQSEKSRQEEMLYDLLSSKGESIASLLNQYGAILMAEFDYEALDRLASNTAADAEIEYVVFYDAEGKAINNAQGTDQTSLKVKKNLVADQQQIGTIEIGLNDGLVKQNIEIVRSRTNATITEAGAEKQRTVLFLVILVVIISLTGVAILSFALFQLVSRIIVKPIHEIIRFANQMAEGNLSADIHKIERDNKVNNEIDQLIDALHQMTVVLEQKVKVSEEIAKGNLNVEVSLASEHDVLGKALTKMVDQLNSLLTQLVLTANDLKSKSIEMARSANVISSGANQQSKALEDISAAVAQLESQTQSNSENANIANLKANEARGIAESGNGLMQNMLTDMEEISSTSKGISDIIKTIDEIAFQTNLLALNAAVEAARAGTQGKGFAVVADEVRNLAQRSARASRETTSMITESLKKIDVGANTANETSQALDQITTGTLAVTDLVQNISVSSNEQASGVMQVNKRLQELIRIVQTNATNAQNSLTASEELDSQANLLNQLADSFQLRQTASPQANDLEVSETDEIEYMTTPNRLLTN